MLVWLIFSVLCFSLATIEVESETKLENMQSYLKELSDLTTKGVDILEKLEKFKDKIPVLIRMAGPVGTIVAEFAKLAFAMESDELKAINTLHDTVKEGFSDIKERLATLHNEAQYEDQMRDYGINVKDRIADLRENIEMFFSREADHAQAKLDLIHSCGVESLSPNSILRYIIRIVRDQCRPPTQTESQKYVKMYGLFRRFADETLMKELVETADFRSEDVGNLTLSDYEDWMIAALQYSTSSWPEYLVDVKVKQIEKHVFNSTGNAAKKYALLQNIVTPLYKPAAQYRDGGNQESNVFSCFLTKVAYKFQHNRDAMYTVLSVIFKDLIELEKFGTICAGVRGQQTFLLNRQHNYIEEIIKAMYTWTTQTLEVSWPHIILFHAKLDLGTKPLKPEDYINVANKIRDSTNNRGPANYVHQIVISNNDATWHKSGRNCEIINNTEEQKVNVLISRYNRSAVTLQQAKESNEWYHSKIDSIKKQLYQASENDDVDVSYQIAFTPIVTNPLVTNPYDNGLLIQRRTFWGTNCVINVKINGTAIKEDSAMQTYNELAYDTQLYFGKWTCFRLIFLL